MRVQVSGSKAGRRARSLRPRNCWEIQAPFRRASSRTAESGGRPRASNTFSAEYEPVEVTTNAPSSNSLRERTSSPSLTVTLPRVDIFSSASP